MASDIDPYEDTVEPEERQHHIDTGEPARGEDELEQHYRMQEEDKFATTFVFDGEVSGWHGRKPEKISGTVNPTLNLKAGKRYEVIWENVDGLPHNFVIADPQGNTLVRTPIISQEGKKQRLTFTAAADMTTYFCEVHPSSMRGNVKVPGGPMNEPQEQEEEKQKAAAGKIPKLDVSTNMLVDDEQRADSWLQYDKGLEQKGFSPADLLDPENVASLNQAYTVTTDSAGLQTNPIVVPSDPPVMYFTTSNMEVHAVNARTGNHYWTFKYALPKTTAGQVGRNRGVAVLEDKVFFATVDTHLVALNRYTGEKQWDIDLHTDRMLEEMKQPERMSITQAPLTFNGKVLVGMSADFGGWSVVSSVDAEDGEINWQTNMAPPDNYVGDSWFFASNAPWMSPSVDHETNTVFYAVGNPCPMLNGLVRPGPNKWSDSIVAIDIESGDIKWANQILSHELWDYDAMATPKVVDLKVNGETRRALIHHNKTGWTYVFDAEDGQLIERTKPWAKQKHEWADNDHFLALPPKGEENVGAAWPGTPGASEWPPDAYSPQTGLSYVGGVDAAGGIYYDPDWEYKPKAKIELAVGGAIGVPVDTTHEAFVAAVDNASGDLVWQTRIADASEEWSHWRIWPGGTTATAGNIVFNATPGGSVLALDAETGERLWQGHTDADRITAGPVVWTDPTAEVQYLAVAANDEIVVWNSGGFGQ